MNQVLRVLNPQSALAWVLCGMATRKGWEMPSSRRRASSYLEYWALRTASNRFATSPMPASRQPPEILHSAQRRLDRPVLVGARRH